MSVPGESRVADAGDQAGEGARVMTNIVLLTTAWGRKHGGVNAFNEDLCVALAARLGRGGNVYCAVVGPTGHEIADAASRGVTLIPINKSKAGEFDETWAHYVLSWMKAERPGQEIDWWVGHDVVSGEAALYGAGVQGRAALIHHMNYHAYQVFKTDDANAAIAKYDRQKALFGKNADALFAVGPRLWESCRELSGRDVVQLIPGFPEGLPSERSSDSLLKAITFGRLDPSSDRIKQGRLAAAAFGEAVRRVRLGGREDAKKAVLYAVGAATPGLPKAEDPAEIAEEAANERLAVYTLSYEEDADKLFRRLSECNLAMMLSLHEGFGLVGWEAIAAEAPLILSRESGLYDLIQSVGPAKGCVHDVLIRGDNGATAYRPDDVDAVASAVVKVWSNLRAAKDHARDLKRILIEKFGCRWEDTATTFLAGLGVDVPPPGGGEGETQGGIPRRVFTRNEPINSVPRCAELTVDTTQGSSAEAFDLVPELRFGRWGFDVDDLRVTYGLREASLTLSLAGCAIAGARLGDSAASSSAVAATGDNRWIIMGPTENDILLRKALGNEALCAIRCDGEVAHVELNLTCAKADVVYTFEAAKAEALSVTSERILGIFLDKCLGRANHATGDVSLSRVVLAIGAAQ